MAYYGIALHTPEFGSSVYMVFFFGALSELPMTIISKLISHKIKLNNYRVCLRPQPTLLSDPSQPSSQTSVVDPE
jgi:hypothetical protein